MKALAFVTKSALTRTIALALVAAFVVVGTAITKADLDPNQTHNFTVKVYNGDPNNNDPIGRALVTLSDGTRQNTDGNGIVTMLVHEGEYGVTVSASGFGSQTFNVVIDSDTTLEASLVSSSPQPSPDPSPSPSPSPTPSTDQHQFNVVVFDGDPNLNHKISGASIAISNGTNGTTDGSGFASFNIAEGSYSVLIGANLSNYYSRTFNVVVDSDTTLEASLINKTPNTQVVNTGDECLPTPPTGKPMLNIWPISETPGATCSDYHFLAAKNATQGGSYITGGGTVNASTGDTIRVELYIHNGVVDLPEDTAHNVMVKVDPSSNSGAIRATAWADNADLITSAEKGGDVNMNINGSNTVVRYVSGSTKLYDNNGNFQSNLPDGITGANGVNIGDMRGCWQFLHFVTFDLKVISNESNPTPTPQPNPNPSPTPSLSIQKTVRNVSNGQTSFADSVNADINDTVEFKVVVSNQNATANNVVVNDSLPAGLSFVSNSLTIDGSNSSNNLSSIGLGNMGAGSSRTILFRATVDSFSTSSTRTFVNTATAYASNANSVSDTASVVVTVNNNPSHNVSLDIEKTVANITTDTGFSNSVDAKVNQKLTYKIVVTNTGNSDAQDVVITDDLPAGISFEDDTTVSGAPFTGSISDGHSIHINSLDAGDSVTIKFDARVTSSSCNKTVTNTATADADNASKVSDSANVDVARCSSGGGGGGSSGSADLTESKLAWNDTQNRDATTVVARAGDIITYTLTVKNTGSRTEDNFDIVDNISGVLQFADVIDIDGGSLKGNTITYKDIDIKARSTVNRAFKVRVRSSIPQTFGCVMSNTYGNTVNVNVNCVPVTPPPFHAPQTGAGADVSIMLSLLTVLGFAGYKTGYLYKLGKLTGFVA